MQRNKRKYDDSQLPAKKRGSLLSTTPTGLFSHTQIPAAEPHPFRAALEQFLSLMRHDDIRSYHLSNILREIARYHRHTVVGRKVLAFELDIYNLIKLLNEEAIALKPDNKLAKAEYKFFIEKVTVFASHKTDNKLNSENPVLHRKEAFIRFWNMIDVYIKRISLLYPTAQCDFFSRALIHLANTGSTSDIKQMLHEHVPTEKQQNIPLVFQNAILALADLQLGANKLTGQKP